MRMTLDLCALPPPKPESQSHHEKNIRHTHLRDILQNIESVLLQTIKLIKKRKV